jgi:hypothetical protein
MAPWGAGTATVICAVKSCYLCIGCRYSSSPGFEPRAWRKWCAASRSVRRSRCDSRSALQQFSNVTTSISDVSPPSGRNHRDCPTCLAMTSEAAVCCHNLRPGEPWKLVSSVLTIVGAASYRQSAWMMDESYCCRCSNYCSLKPLCGESGILRQTHMTGIPRFFPRPASSLWDTPLTR